MQNWDFPGGPVVKNLLHIIMGLIPGWGTTCHRATKPESHNY